MLTPVRVGALVAAAVVAFIAFYIGVNKNKFSKSSTYVVSALFEDATGLAPKTHVQIAGIDVGRIERVELEGKEARVFLRIRNDVPLFVDASIAKVSESLLGDFKLDINPGSPVVSRLKDGDEILHVQSQSDLNAIEGEMRQIAVNVRQVTDSLAKVLGGPNGENALRTIVERIESATKAIDSIATTLDHTVQANNQNINEILRNVAALSAKLNGIADSVSSVIGSNQGDIKSSVATLKSAVEKLDSSLSNLQSVTHKIDDGQGTIGKLVNDPELHDNVNQVVEDAGGLIKKIVGIQTEVDLRSEYNFPTAPDDVLIPKSGYLKNYVTLKLRPKPDKYYMFSLITDPLGSSDRTVTTSHRTLPDKTQNTDAIDDTTTISFNSLKFSLEFAKRFYFATFRFGIIENTGGAGIDLDWFNDRFELKTDVFDFGDRDRFGNALNPEIKSFLSYEPINHLYFSAGVDNPLNRHYTAITGGGGVRFTDDDLRALIGTITAAAAAR